MLTWILGYDGGLYLKYEQSINDRPLTKTAFYKMKLAWFVDTKNSTEGLIKFNLNTSYITFCEIISNCQQKCDSLKYKLIITDELQKYISERQIYIDKRYNLGNEIKQHDSKLKDRFEKFSEVVNSRMSRQLRPQQMWDSFFMCSMQKSANFSVPGSGKTSSVLGVYAYLKSLGLVSKIVVVCPKNAFGSWIDEFDACFHGKEKLKLFNIHDKKLKNKDSKVRSLLFDNGNTNLFLINYEILGAYLTHIEKIVQNKTLLVYDEVHKVKNINGEQAKDALALSKYSSRTIVMTGTPIPNGYIDIYNLLNILFSNEYEDFFGFDTGTLKSPSDADIKNINNKIQPFFCRTTKDQLKVPKPNLDKILSVQASETENEILRILKMKYRNNLLAFLVRILQLESNPRLLLERLNIEEFKHLLDSDVKDIEDLDFEDYSNQIQALLKKAPIATKFKKCVQLASELVKQNKVLIIWCIFKNSITSISTALESLGIKTLCIYGEVPLEDRLSLIDDFKNGKYQVLITNPHTLAESVSLHKVCHDAIYFEYSYNLVHLLQSKDRIHRLGLPENQYTQYYFMQQNYMVNDSEEMWSMDEKIYDRLNDKEDLMLKAIANNQLEIMPTSEEDLQIIFDKLNL